MMFPIELKGIDEYKFNLVRDGLDVIVVIDYKFNDKWYTAKSGLLGLSLTQKSPYDNIVNIISETIRVIISEINQRIREISDVEKLHY